MLVISSFGQCVGTTLSPIVSQLLTNPFSFYFVQCPCFIPAWGSGLKMPEEYLKLWFSPNLQVAWLFLRNFYHRHMAHTRYHLIRTPPDHQICRSIVQRCDFYESMNLYHCTQGLRISDTKLVLALGVIFKLGLETVACLLGINFYSRFCLWPWYPFDLG